MALPVFQELMLEVYREGLVGPAPAFPTSMEDRITASLAAPSEESVGSDDAREQGWPPRPALDDAPQGPTGPLPAT